MASLGPNELISLVLISFWQNIKYIYILHQSATLKFGMFGQYTPQKDKNVHLAYIFKMMFADNLEYKYPMHQYINKMILT